MLSSDHIGTVFVLNELSDNQAAGSGGAIALMGTGNGYVIVMDCTLTSNRAGSAGGGIYIVQLSYSTLSGNAFVSNSAHETGGGVCFSGGGHVLLTESAFMRNSAGRGGGLDVTSVTDLRIVSNSFISNIGTAGCGSAVRASLSEGMIINLNVFRNNHAVNGGTVYWELDSMSEPTYLSYIGVPTYSGADTGNISKVASLIYGEKWVVSVNNLSSESNYWSGNYAAYGPDFATDLYTIKATTDIAVLRYDTMFPTVTVEGYDYYGQRIVTEDRSLVSMVLDKTTAASNCYPYLGSLVGMSERSLLNGSVVFTELIGYCRPGAAYDLVFSVSGLQNSTVTQVSFQSCLKGDQGTGQTCMCPSGAGKCSGSDVFVDRGYWRINQLSNTLLTCPMGIVACAGGNGTEDKLCAVGYTGPLCAVCSNGFLKNSFKHACNKCEHKPTAVAIVMLILFVVAVVIVFWRFLNISGEILHSGIYTNRLFKQEINLCTTKSYTRGAICPEMDYQNIGPFILGEGLLFLFY